MIPERKIKEAAFIHSDRYVNSDQLLDYEHHFIAGVQWALEQLSFKKPSFEEVRAEFIYKGGNNDLAESFWNHYEANNWMVGKVKMKKWTNAVAQWCARENKTKTVKSKLEQNVNHVQRNMR